MRWRGGESNCLMRKRLNMRTIDEVKEHCRFFGDELVGYGFDAETCDAMREIADIARLPR